MKKYLKLLPILLFFTVLSCSKESITSIGKLSGSQVQARLKNFPEILSLNDETEGEFQVTSSINAFGGSMGLPPRNGISGFVKSNLNSSFGIDVGTLYVGATHSQIYEHQDIQKYGVYYGTPTNIGSNDVYGKIVPYYLKKDEDTPIFEGQMYVPKRITFDKSNNGTTSYWSLSSGKVTWTSDIDNPIGVGVTFLCRNSKGQTRGEAFLTDDDGILEAKDFLLPSDSIYTEVSLTLYRGNGTVRTGSDDKKYKLVVYSTCYDNFYLKP